MEDHTLQRARTEELIRRDIGGEVVFSGSTAPAFHAWLRSAPAGRRPHLLILDLLVERKPSVEVELVEKLLKSGLKIVVLSALAFPPLVRAMVRAGVSGIVSKRDSERDTADALRAVLRGEEWMTQELAAVIAGDEERPELSVQEERALVLYASGLNLPDVAEYMNISSATAKQYLDRVKAKYTKVGVPVHSKLDFGRVAWAEGYVDPSAPITDVISLPRPGSQA